MPPTMTANTSVAVGVSSPAGRGRQRVRSILASIFCSTRQLTAAAAPATSAMPTVAKKTLSAGGSPGTARNMPITAQKTISDTTRGLVSARNCRKRLSASARVVMVGAGKPVVRPPGRGIQDRRAGNAFQLCILPRNAPSNVRGCARLRRVAPKLRAVPLPPSRPARQSTSRGLRKAARQSTSRGLRKPASAGRVSRSARRGAAW